MKLRAESATAFGVTVQFGDDNGTDVDFFFKGTSLGLAGLTDRCIHHENDIIRFLQFQKIGGKKIKNLM